MIYVDLKADNVDYVLDKLRSLPWKEPVELDIWYAPENTPKADEIRETKRTVDVSHNMKTVFTKIVQIRWNQVECMADLVAGLGEYYPNFRDHVLDDILEQIRVGMEEYTHTDYNQRRILVIRYLGELYNYEVASSTTVFDKLYSLITYGHPLGKPSRVEKYHSFIDGPTNFFRIRLVCEL